MSTPVPLSVIVLTLNEEANIGPCLESLAGWADEIFVVDSGSEDRTLEIVSRFTNNVVLHAFDGYAEQRNWAQDHLPLRHEWVLHLDADERVSPELRKAIADFTGGSLATGNNGALISRRTIFLGRWIRHGGHYPVYHARLFRRGRGRCEDRLYDQHFLVDAPVVTLTGDLVNELSSDLDSWSQRHIAWARREAEEMLRPSTSASGQVSPRATGTPIERRRWLRARLFGRLPLFGRAFAYFVYRYVIRLGFLDGPEGLIFHFLQGCWFRFYVDAKIWQARQGQATTVIGHR